MSTNDPTAWMHDRGTDRLLRDLSILPEPKETEPASSLGTPLPRSSEPAAPGESAPGATAAILIALAAFVAAHHQAPGLQLGEPTPPTAPHDAARSSQPGHERDLWAGLPLWS